MMIIPTPVARFFLQSFFVKIVKRKAEYPYFWQDPNLRDGPRSISRLDLSDRNGHAFYWFLSAIKRRVFVSRSSNGPRKPGLRGPIHPDLGTERGELSAAGSADHIRTDLQIPKIILVLLTIFDETLGIDIAEFVVVPRDDIDHEVNHALWIKL